MVALSRADSKLLSRLAGQDYCSTKSRENLGVDGLLVVNKVAKSPRVLGDTEILAAITRHNGGVSIKEICAEYDCSREYLAKLLKSCGVKIIRRSRLPREVTAQVLRLHKNGLSSRKIQATIGVNYKTVQRIIWRYVNR
jgi:hypothetical protein